MAPLFHQIMLVPIEKECSSWFEKSIFELKSNVEFESNVRLRGVFLNPKPQCITTLSDQSTRIQFQNCPITLNFNNALHSSPSSNLRRSVHVAPSHETHSFRKQPLTWPSRRPDLAARPRFLLPVAAQTKINLARSIPYRNFP